MTLTRAGSAVMEVWPLALRDPLPDVPVPLRAPDADVTLELNTALKLIYEEAAYDLSIDYRQPPPPPPFGDGEVEFVRGIVSTRQRDEG